MTPPTRGGLRAGEIASETSGAADIHIREHPPHPPAPQFWGGMGRKQREQAPFWGTESRVIAVKKLDGSTMHLNEDLIERVEDAGGGQSAVYLRDGGHIIVANDPTTVVELVRTEKVAMLRRVLAWSRGTDHAVAPDPRRSRA